MKKTITIEGMTCNNCVRHVTESLKEVEGVSSVAVYLKDKKANVEVGPSVTDAALIAAIDEAGYTAVSVSQAS